MSDDDTVGKLGFSNGEMLYAMLDEEKTGVHEYRRSGKAITKDGNIIAQDYTSLAKRKALRPGLRSLEEIGGKHWTMDRLLEIEAKFTHKIKRQEESICKKVTRDSSSVNDFQRYSWNFNFQKIRYSHLLQHI